MTPRELDRFGIEERKLVEGCLRRGIDLKNDDIDAAVESLTFALRLAAINAAIWERENRIRALEREGERGDTETFCKAVVTLAFEITRLNDWRSELIGEEKIHG
jgi:hypothetical protein